jgi:NifU-like protein involved in Fe-S cluster formation
MRKMSRPLRMPVRPWVWLSDYTSWRSRRQLVVERPANLLLLLDHYNRPRNVGSMSKADADVGTGLVGAPACGDVMKLQIRVDPNNNTFGCGSAIASSSYLTELVRGMSLEDASKIRNTEIAKELCLPPVKREYLVCCAKTNVADRMQCTAPCSPKTPSSQPSQTTTPRTRMRGNQISEAPGPPCRRSRLRLYQSPRLRPHSRRTQNKLTTKMNKI